MNGENETVQYLYEKGVKLMMPIMQMPLSFPGFIGQITAGRSAQVNSVLAFNRPEFEQFVKALVSFERRSKPMGEKCNSNTSSNISRRSFMNNSGRNELHRICQNHPRLAELYDFMGRVDDDFIAYVLFRATKIGMPSSFDVYDDDYGTTTKYNLNFGIEFSVGIDGFDLVGPDGRVVDSCKHPLSLRAAKRWESVFIDRLYLNDFSGLLLTPDKNSNVIIYLADYVKH